MSQSQQPVTTDSSLTIIDRQTQTHPHTHSDTHTDQMNVDFWSAGTWNSRWSCRIPGSTILDFLQVLLYMSFRPRTELSSHHIHNVLYTHANECLLLLHSFFFIFIFVLNCIIGQQQPSLESRAHSVNQVFPVATAPECIEYSAGVCRNIFGVAFRWQAV